MNSKSCQRGRPFLTTFINVNKISKNDKKVLTKNNIQYKLLSKKKFKSSKNTLKKCNFSELKKFLKNKKGENIL